MNLTDRLSKSRYMAGLQCPRRLYLTVHHRELATPPSPETEGRFATGHAVGDLAQARFPTGVLVTEDYLHHREAVATTRELVEQGASDIFEAAFAYDNIKVRVDVLHRLEGSGWELIEVKSTGGYKAEKHLPDIGVQLYVLRGCGIDVRKVSLMHLDKTYVYPGGQYDPQQILASTDATTDAFEYANTVAPLVAEMMRILGLAEPPEPGDSVTCTKPYECEFYAWCTRDDEQPDYSGVPMSANEAILKRLDDLTFPLLFVDFETLNPGLPIFPGTSPFQVMKVQWSLHRLEADGTLTHAEWLADTAERDPSEEFLTTLLDALGSHGTFIHYSPYEITQLVDLAVRLPQLRERLLAAMPGLHDKVAAKLRERGEDVARPDTAAGLGTFDLGARAVKGGCIHPLLDGRWSIKCAIEVLAPNLPPYASLDVSNGDQAMLATTEMLDAGTPPDRRTAIREALLRYCQQDTMAMVEIYRTLHDHLHPGR